MCKRGCLGQAPAAAAAGRTLLRCANQPAPAQLQVPLWNQRAGRVDGLVCWDYHVLLLQRTPAGTLVWDLDR